MTQAIRFFISLLFLTCMVVVAAPYADGADGADPVDPVDQPVYLIRAAAVNIAGGNATLWLRTGPGKEPVKLPLNIRIFSEPVKYKGPVIARFYASEVDAMADDPPNPIAQVKLPRRNLLILFQPKPDTSGYTGLPVADSRFPFGSFHLVNLSEDKIGVDMAAKKMIIPPGKSKTYSLPAGERDVLISIVARSKITSKARYVRRSRWSIAPDQRELVLFYPNPINGMIHARHFIDSKTEKIGPE